MKRFIRLLSLVLLIMSTSGNTFAEEKVNVVKQGTIRGRIVDTSKRFCREPPSILKNYTPE